MSTQPLTAIGDLVEPVSSWTPERDDPDGVFTYIDLGSVDQDAKAISAARELTCAEAPSRARQRVRAGDVVVSTVRPNLNGVAQVQSDLDGATASTGFCVLRPRAGVLDGGYLFQWVKSPLFVSEMVRRATGASYPAVSDRIICETKLPLPPLSEQRRIAEILDKADALRVKRRAAIARLDTLTQAVFLDMFGDPGTNESGWPTHAVSAYVRGFTGGRSMEAEVGENVVTHHRVLKVSAVTGNKFLAEHSKPVPDSHRPDPEHFVRAGDLLFSRANTTELVGAVAFVSHAPPNLLLPDKLWRFVWRDPSAVDPLFVWALFQTAHVRNEIGRRATGTSGSMKNISQEKVMGIRTILPPVERQRRFAECLRAAEKLTETMAASLADQDALFASIQHRAFRGELPTPATPEGSPA